MQQVAREEISVKAFEDKLKDLGVIDQDTNIKFKQDVNGTVTDVVLERKRTLDDQTLLGG